VAARPPANRLRAFPGDERHHEQPRRRISPPPAEPCVETETGQKDRGQIRTDLRLTRLRLQCTAPETARDPALKWTRSGITINDNAAMTIPIVDGSGARRSSKARMAP